MAKKNIGIEGLNALEIANAVEGADLTETKKKNEKSRVAVKSDDSNKKIKTITISLPVILHTRFTNAKNEGKHFGSLSSYIFEALKEKLDQDGFY